MTPEEFNSILAGLAGREIKRKNIAGNSLLLFLDLHSIHKFALSLWVEPPWRIEFKGHIETTSADIPWEKEENETEVVYKDRLESIWALSDNLNNLKIISATLDLFTSDLQVQFEEGYVLKTFTVLRDSENLILRDFEHNHRYDVGVKSIIARPLEKTN